MNNTKKTTILIFIFFITSITVSQSKSDETYVPTLGEDRYTFYDKTGRFPLAEIIFNTKVTQYNQTFSINYTVTYNIIDHRFDDNWELKEFHYEINKIYSSCWSEDNETMKCNVRNWDEIYYKGDITPNQSDSTIQNITAPSYWTGEKFGFSTEFVNMHINTLDRGLVGIPKYFYFVYTENGCQSDPVDEIVNLAGFVVSPWEIYGNNFKTVINWLDAIIIISYLVILVRIVRLFVNLLSFNPKETFLFWKSYNDRDQTVYICNQISRISKVSGWFILLLLAQIKIHQSINSMEIDPFTSFQYLFFFISIILTILIPLIFVEIQLWLIKNREQELLKAKNISTYLDFKSVQKEIMITNSHFKDILLLFAGPLVVYLMDQAIIFL